VTFQGSGSIDTGNVSGGGGGGGGRIALGGGAGLLITIVALLFGVNPGDLLGSQAAPQQGTSSAASEIQQQLDACTWEMANENTICRIKATTVSLDQVWSDLMPGYEAPKTVIFADSVNTACGAASSATGPFYCPADHTAYFDPSFFTQLRRMGGSDGPLAQEYVVAHEYGHAVQNLTGALARGQRLGSQGPTSGSVRVELQADCLAGVWANKADDGPDALLQPITQQQISSVIQTAQAIGDDTIQGSRSNPESWTHGSATQRAKWFSIGYQSGDPKKCDTFATNDL